MSFNHFKMRVRFVLFCSKEPAAKKRKKILTLCAGVLEQNEHLEVADVVSGLRKIFSQVDHKREGENRFLMNNLADEIAVCRRDVV